MAATGIVTAFGASWAIPARADGPSARDRAAAAEAFDQGSALWLAKRYDKAAGYFETAHRLAPNAGTLVQAVRAHEKAGNALRAATLALRLEALYSDDALAAKTARKVLDASADEYVRVDVSCGGCTLEVDGAIYEHPSFFLEPDREHEVTAAFTSGDVSETVSAGAGETVAITLEAPPEPQPPKAETSKPSVAAPSDTTMDERRSIVAPAVPIVFGGFTVATGALTLWSGLETLEAKDTYEQDPTPERFANGRNLEKRTNAFIGMTAVLGAATIATTILALVKKEPDRDTEARVRAVVGLDRDRGWAGIEGRLP